MTYFPRITKPTFQQREAIYEYLCNNFPTLPSTISELIARNLPQYIHNIHSFKPSELTSFISCDNSCPYPGPHFYILLTQELLHHGL